MTAAVTGTERTWSGPDPRERMAWTRGHPDKWWALRALAETNEQDKDSGASE